jgi:hypothetical protein
MSEPKDNPDTRFTLSQLGVEVPDDMMAISTDDESGIFIISCKVAGGIAELVPILLAFPAFNGSMTNVLQVLAACAGGALGNVIASNYTGPDERAREIREDLARVFETNVHANFEGTRLNMAANEARKAGQVQ